MIPLFKPYMPELPKLDEILHSGALSYGTYTKQFEDTLRDYFGTPYLIAVGSFSSAISVALTTLGLTYEDEVIVSPMACLASTQPLLTSGMKIRWCDVDPLTGTIDPEALKRIISAKSKAIVHNHFCGYPGYVDEVNCIAAEYGIPVIDDGIECFGSEYKGKKIGACGTDVTVFSLGAVRIPNTIDGGIVIFKDKKYYEKSLQIRDCGIDRTIFRDKLGEINPMCDISGLGYAATMSNVNGYIGERQMKYADLLITQQRANAQKWDDIIDAEQGVRSLCTLRGRPNYWVYGVLADDKRKAILRYRDQGYYASGVHINNNIYSVFGDQRPLRGAEEFHNHFVALPCGWWIEESQIRERQ